jgi:crossover junction endodeoxyribonuclease RuvC
VRIFGIDPGSERTGYGCVDTDGRRHRLVDCGAVATNRRDGFPAQLLTIYKRLTALLAHHRPECVAIESLFHAVNVRSALKLGHARGVAVLAAVENGFEVAEYTPAQIKLAVVGYGRAEKHQVQEMVKLILGLEAAPAPHDAADALAVAICHLNRAPLLAASSALAAATGVTSPAGGPLAAAAGVTSPAGGPLAGAGGRKR